MKKYILSKEQLSSILDNLNEDIIGGENFSSSYEDDEFSIELNGFCDIDSYIEDDYYCGYENGTGSYIETSRNGSFEYTAYIINSDNNEYEEVSIDDESINEINNFLNTPQN